MALGGNPAPGTLSGTTVVRTISGVATFNDLSIEAVSLGYTLTASARGLSGVSSVPFAIAKPTASVHITAATSGSLPDPDGYAACIDPTSDGHGGITCAYDGPLAVGVNGSGTVTVDTGAHAVLLTGVAANCTVGGNPRTVHLALQETGEVPFDIACAAASLHITTATTGASIDPDGYRLCIDHATDWESDYSCVTDEGVGVNSGVTVPVEPGTHYVELDSVAHNCTVSGDNPRTVDAGAATEVSFVIACVAIGTVHVTSATTGIDVPGAYGVCVDPSGTRCLGGSAWVPANGTVTISGVIAGPHIVNLNSVAVNCTISGSSTRAVTVPVDGTVDAAFAVA
jgi:hypothetical protein